MKGTVVIFGASGFLGRYLTRHYLRHGREVVAVARSHSEIDPRAMCLEWDGRSLGPWALALEGADLVINLTGRSVDCRYDDAHRRQIMDSRVESTRVIGEAVMACSVAPKIWMNSSTATWYRHAEDTAQDEWSGEPGEGFSFDVARRWEETFFSAGGPGRTRKLALRIGMVLANEPDTVFDVMSRLVRFGLGGAMGGGRQRVSWIHLDDLIAAIDFLEDQPLVDGVVNLTAPNAPTNREMMRSMRELRAMPIGLPATRWMMEIGARVLSTETELVLKSRWVAPLRLGEAGFRWRWPQLAPALADLIERPGVEGFYAVPAKRSVGARAWTAGRALGPSAG